MTELAFRSRSILFAAITEYISSGEPVGSRTLEKRYSLNLSAATIRNVLSDLEDGGYLAQPHTSAGRIPTDKGFRAFVDALVQMRDVAVEDQAAIMARMQILRPGVDDVMRETGRILSSLTGAAAVVMPPRPEDERLMQMRFMPLRAGELLAVLVTRSGNVQNRVVRVSKEIDTHALERVHNYLDELVREGRTLTEARDTLAADMQRERDHYDALRKAVKQILDATIDAAEGRSEMLIEGQGRLLDRPEFADVDKVRALLRTFEEKEKLLELLDRTMDSRGVQVLIGAETNLGAVQDLSVVSASYSQGGNATGSIGVIGPTRMDYGKVVPLVGFAAEKMGELLDKNRKDRED
ncbi:MAG: heat-inducible transcription repressor HrcA [Sandaracinaceae bacterium]|jgi:heat-inducible transcriptional repressor|nr:heat-inducible transcription repressor HrcA [Sandaracinaceae bacterium]